MNEPVAYVSVPSNELDEVRAALANANLEFLKIANGRCWFRPRGTIHAIPPAVPAAVDDSSECVFEMDSREGVSDEPDSVD